MVMKLKNLQYFSTILIFGVAFCAAWWMWNYYMQSPWTRDGKVRADIVNITPSVSGRITKMHVRDNQKVKKGDLLVTLDQAPFQIALDNAKAALTKSAAEVKKAEHELNRRRNLSRVAISAEALDEVLIQTEVAKAAYQEKKANLEQAKWDFSQTQIYAPTDGFITNLKTRVGNYADESTPLFGLVDANSFYVLGYFEETKLKHIQVGDTAQVTLYADKTQIQGKVESIGRAIYDQNVEESDDLLMNVKPNVPWVRLAQRVPIRIDLGELPKSARLVAGTTCSIAIEYE